MSRVDLKRAIRLSAIMFGGIFAKDRLRAFDGANLGEIRHSDGQAWMTWTRSPGKANERPETWFPDALTTLLIARFHEEATPPEKTESSGNASAEAGDPVFPESVKQTIASLELPPWRAKVMDYLRAAEVSSRLQISGVSAAYAKGEVISHSIPDGVRCRLAHWCQNRGAGEEIDRDPMLITGDPVLTRARYERTERSVSQLEVIGKVSRILKSQQRVVSRLTELQDENAGKLWPVTDLLIEWSKSLLSGEGERAAVAHSTAREYFLMLARRFLWIAEDDDLLDYDPEDFETLYELSAGRVRTTAQRGRFWGRVRLFHDFMFLSGAPDVDLTELDGYVAADKVRVSANLIGEKEFDQFKAALSAEIERTGQYSLRMVLLAGILGYRMGLRRREVQLLRLRDYHPGRSPCLLVRPSRLARLKTKASRRQLPVSVLLLPDEQRLLESFIELRKSQDQGDAGLLFAFPGTPDMPVPVERLIDPVVEIFRAICSEGGIRFRFHHLRHSFANWAFLALVTADQPELLDDRPSFIDSGMLTAERRKQIHEGLFPRLAGTESAAGRRHLYQVAALMGHLSPDTTLRSYLHVMDWLSGRELDLALNDLLSGWSAAQLGKLCGMGHAMAFREPYKSLHEEPTRFLRKFAKHRLPKAGRVHPSKEDHSKDVERLVRNLGAPSMPSFLVGMTVVGRYHESKDAKALERLFSIPAEAIERTAKAYYQMYAKRAGPDAKKSFLRPYEPRNVADREEFWRIATACQKSYLRPENRPAMQAAAEALIRRTGPKLGHIRFGKQLSDAPLVVRGLICMGIPPSDLTLAICHPPDGPGVSDPTESAIKAIQAIGIKCSDAILDWETRRIVQTLLRLDIDCSRKSGPRSGERWGLRVAALNYSAMWLRLVAGSNELEATGLAALGDRERQASAGE